MLHFFLENARLRIEERAPKRMELVCLLLIPLGQPFYFVPQSILITWLFFLGGGWMMAFSRNPKTWKISLSCILTSLSEKIRRKIAWLPPCKRELHFAVLIDVLIMLGFSLPNLIYFPRPPFESKPIHLDRRGVIDYSESWPLSALRNNSGDRGP